MKTTKKYCAETGTRIEAICSTGKNQEDIEKLMKIWDTNKWLEEMNSKSSIAIYRKFKKSIKEEKEYDNTQSSALLYKARANVLALNDRKRHQNEDTKCPLCNHLYENMEHFILDCEELENIRSENIVLQRPHLENKDDIIGNFLFKNNIRETKETLKKL